MFVQQKAFAIDAYLQCGKKKFSVIILCSQMAFFIVHMVKYVYEKNYTLMELSVHCEQSEKDSIFVVKFQSWVTSD